MERFEQLRREREGLRPQEVLQMFLFEHLLLRLEKTSYVDKFILKGGLLISSMIGVSLRTTMDMDSTVVGMPALHNWGCSWGLNPPVSRSDRVM